MGWPLDGYIYTNGEIVAHNIATKVTHLTCTQGNTDGEEEFKVKKILNSRVCYDKLQYLIKWLGYSDADNECIPQKQAAGSADLVKLFHKLYPKKRREGKEKKSIVEQGETWPMRSTCVECYGV